MILVTGSNGYIGSHIADKLNKANTDYIGIDNFSYSKKQKNKKTIKCDIGDLKKLSNILKDNNIKTVIHAAAASYVNESELKKKFYYNNNVIKTKKFISLITKKKIKNFIFFSTSNVYKKNNYLSAYKENDLKKPINEYGNNKLEIEKFLKSKRFNNLIILRVFNIIGKNKNFTPYKFNNDTYQRLFFKLTHAIKNKKKITLNIIKNKDNIIYPSRDFLDVFDLTNLIMKILLKLKKSNIRAAFNVGNGKHVYINKLINQFEKIIKKKIKYTQKVLPEKEINFTLANISLVKKTFNWKPKITLRKSILSHLR